MHPTRRLLHAALLLMLAALMSAVVPFALAQDAPTDLDPADDALLAAANDNSRNFITLAYTFNTTFDLAGVGPRPIALDLSGQGQIDTNTGAFALALNGAADFGTGTLLPVDVELRQVDGTLYLRGLAGPGVWQSFTLDELAALGANFAGGLGAPADPTAGAETLDALGLDAASLAQFTAALAALQPLTYVTTVREDDLLGQAVFRYTLDGPALAQDPALRQLLLLGLRANDSSLAPADAEAQAAEAQAADAQAALVDALADSELSYVQRIDPAVNEVRSAVLTVDVTGIIELLLVFEISLDAYNLSTDITVPDGAVPLSVTG